MRNKTNWVLKNLHLLISVAIVVPTAIIYGAAPTLLPQFLDIQASTNDLSNFLRAVMCLYLGVSSIWTLGIVKAKYWKSATQLNALFMLTLATGRGLSMILDGLPTRGYIFAIVAELVLGLHAIHQLKKDRTD